MKQISVAIFLLLLPISPLLAQSAAPDATPFPKPPSIKGLQMQMVDDALALGIHHAGVNINITGLVDLDKRPENPKRVVDGYEFSFHEAYLKSLDAQIKPLSDKGVLVYLIVIAYPSKNAEVDALVIHPDARKDYKYSVGGFNSKTPEGRAWLKAVSLEMASRWSGARPECGRGNPAGRRLCLCLGEMPQTSADRRIHLPSPCRSFPGRRSAARSLEKCSGLHCRSFQQKGDLGTFPQSRHPRVGSRRRVALASHGIGIMGRAHRRLKELGFTSAILI